MCIYIYTHIYVYIYIVYIVMYTLCIYTYIYIYIYMSAAARLLDGVPDRLLLAVVADHRGSGDLSASSFEYNILHIA